MMGIQLFTNFKKPFTYATLLIFILLRFTGEEIKVYSDQVRYVGIDIK